MDVLYSACVFLQYWAGLYSEEMKPLIIVGVETLISMATKIAKNWEHAARRHIRSVGMLSNEQSRQTEAKS
jgi:hypothetical protein